MCGRCVRRSDKQKIAEWFHVRPEPAELPMLDADYNVAPTTYQPIIRQSRETGGRELILARWGLVPFFTIDLKDVKGLTTINARSETITTAPTWREPFKKRRCLVPVSAFYEWPKEGKPPKQKSGTAASSNSATAQAASLSSRPPSPFGTPCTSRGRSKPQFGTDRPSTLSCSSTSPRSAGSTSISPETTNGRASGSHRADLGGCGLPIISNVLYCPFSEGTPVCPRDRSGQARSP